MSTDITDKTMVVVSRLGDFWVTPDRAKRIMDIKQSDPSASIELDGNLIGCATIDGIVTASNYEVINYKRRGAWQCKHGKWHEKFEQCAHGRM